MTEAKSSPTVPAHSKTPSTASSINSSPRDSDEFSLGDSPTAAAPTNLTRERNRLTLRAYLRHLLSTPLIASSDLLRNFLLEPPTELSREEQADVLAREEMDRVREREAQRFRDEVEGRVRELDSYLRKFKDELVKRGMFCSLVDRLMV